MTDSEPELLPNLRRVVTAHNKDGISVVQSNVEIISEVCPRISILACSLIDK